MLMLGLQILMEKSIPNKIQEITTLLNFALFSRKPLAEFNPLKWRMQENEPKFGKLEMAMRPHSTQSQTNLK